MLSAWLLALALTAPAFAADEAPAERGCRPLAKGARLSVDMLDAPLADVVRFVSCAAEVPFLLSPPSLGGRTVTVIAPRPVDRRGLLTVFRAALSDAGLMSEKHGAYYVIRPVDSP